MYNKCVHFNNKYSWLKHLDFIVIDILSWIICYIVSFYIKFNNFNFLSFEFNGTRIYAYIFILGIIVYFLTGILSSIYSGVLERDFFGEFKVSSTIAIVSALFTILLLFIYKVSYYFSRQILITSYISYILISCIVKELYRQALKKGKIKSFNYKQNNIVIVSICKDIDSVIKNVKDGDHLSSINIIKSFCIDKVDCKSIYDYIVHNNVNEVFFSCDPSLIDKEVLKDLINNNIGVHISIRSIFDFYPENTYVSKVGTYHTIGAGLYTFSEEQLIYFGFKRIADVLISTLGILVLLITMIVVKIANICTHDNGKLFYKQIRVGKDGKRFELYKFRSMYEDADERLATLLLDEKYRQEWAKHQKIEDDPRITKVGRVLRKTSLDELPQFINILKGDMSLVGPRPLIPGELESHGGIKLYEQVKPGLTSWWAANGRSLINYDDRLELEYYYVKNASLWLDIKCIVMTFFILLSKKGAQ